jgi:hypothetical protein
MVLLSVYREFSHLLSRISISVIEC